MPEVDPTRTPQPTRPHRVQVRFLARDAEASTVFYAGTFGMKVTERAADGGVVALESGEAKFSRFRVLLVAPGHDAGDVAGSFTLVIESLEEMRTLCVMADLTGGASEEPRRLPDGRWETTLTDPSGNRIKLVQPLPGGRAQGKWAAAVRTPGREAHTRDRAGRAGADARASSRSGQHSRTA